jgi:hypothetical protein
MDHQPAIRLLSDAELDEVTGARGRGGRNGGTTVEIVNITIGELVAAASGDAAVTVNVVGIGNAVTSNTFSSGRHH